MSYTISFYFRYRTYHYKALRWLWFVSGIILKSFPLLIKDLFLKFSSSLFQLKKSCIAKNKFFFSLLSLSDSCHNHLKPRHLKLDKSILYFVFYFSFELSLTYLISFKNLHCIFILGTLTHIFQQRYPSWYRGHWLKSI